ncbi:hypothetical protein CJJ19_02760 [Candidatus Williamhamiltonella defendens]|nr:hypothetical protein CJJ19_02760 [Candidatus Hamiltonella defensa]
MTIYTTPPKSTIQFLEKLNLNKVGDQFKVSKSQMKFQIVPNEKDVPPGEGTTSVQVILKDFEGINKKPRQLYQIKGYGLQIYQSQIKSLKGEIPSRGKSHRSAWE